MQWCQVFTAALDWPLAGGGILAQQLQNSEDMKDLSVARTAAVGTSRCQQSDAALLLQDVRLESERPI